jgi:hypothetical protein
MSDSDNGFNIGPVHITAFVFAIIVILLIILFVYYRRMGISMTSTAAAPAATTAERFTDPNAMDPQTAALLLAHNASDPTSGYMLRKMYTKA